MNPVIKNALKEIIFNFKYQRSYPAGAQNVEFFELCINRINFFILKIEGEPFTLSPFSWGKHKLPLQKAIDDFSTNLVDGFFVFSEEENTELLKVLLKIRTDFQCFLSDIKLNKIWRSDFQYKRPKEDQEDQKIKEVQKCHLVDETENSINIKNPKKNAGFFDFIVKIVPFLD